MESKRESVRKFRNTLLNKTKKNTKIQGSKIYQTEDLSKKITKRSNLLSRLTKFVNYLKAFIYEYNKVSNDKKGDYEAFASLFSVDLLELNSEYKDFLRKHFKISDIKDKEFSYKLLFNNTLVEEEPDVFLTNYMNFIKYLIKKYKSANNSSEFENFTKKLMDNIRLILINNKKLLEISENSSNKKSKNSNSANSMNSVNNTKNIYNPFNNNALFKLNINPFNNLNNNNIKKINMNPFNSFSPEISEKLSNMINTAL
jgi:hypothetical protein